MSAPLAYLITWTTHGSWLPGDERGWVQDGVEGIQPGDAERVSLVETMMSAPPVVLTPRQRETVEETIRDHCRIRGWTLHAVNVRSNHVHAVVTADVAPEVVMNQLKSWCSRRLNEQAGEKKEWWTRHGSTKWINDETYFHNAVRYVLEGQ